MNSKISYKLKYEFLWSLPIVNFIRFASKIKRNRVEE